MGLKLVLAEKPSVAMSIAKAIGANKRNDGFMEGGGYLVSWCVGHLVKLICAGHIFATKGKTILDAGWRLYGDKKADGSSTDGRAEKAAATDRRDCL